MSMTSPAVVNPALMCLTCGFDLRGLSPPAVCPECGIPVERSLQGRLVRFGGADLRARLHQGALLVELAVTVRFAGILLGIVVSFMRAPGFITLHGLSTVGLLLGCAASGAGWWLLTEPHPVIVDLPLRASTRWLTLVLRVGECWLVLSGVAFLKPVIGSRLVGATGLVWLGVVALWVLTHVISMVYLAGLGRRAPSGPLARNAMLVAWLVPVLLAVTAVLVFGCPFIFWIPLIAAFVAYVVVLDLSRRTLRKLLSE